MPLFPLLVLTVLLFTGGPEPDRLSCVGVEVTRGMVRPSIEICPPS
jgi:hypothetical protein